MSNSSTAACKRSAPPANTPARVLLGTVWVADFVGADGKRRPKSLSPDKRIAEKQLEVILQERDLAIYGANTRASQDALLEEVKDAYLMDLAARARPNTVRSARDALTRILGHLDARRVRDITIPKVIAYRTARREGGAAPRTCNIETGGLRACFQSALAAGLIVINPLANLKRLPLDESNQRKKRRALTDAEIAALLRAATDDDDDRARWYAAERTIEHGTKGAAYAAKERVIPVPQRTLWLTLISTGLRWGEAAALRWSDIDSDGRWLVVRAEVAKGRRTRLVPVTAELMAALRDLNQGRVRPDRRTHARPRRPRVPEPAREPLGEPW